MVKSALHYIQESFQKEFAGKKGEFNYKELNRQRLILFRKEKNSVLKIERPTNIARARSLGYKAKKGFIVVRVRVRKGSGTKTRPNKRRKPKRMGVSKLTRKISIQGIAEQRAARKYKNLEVLNSYFIGEDGVSKYFEVILVDPAVPEIRSDKEISFVASRTIKGRAFRGLTSRAKKSRGLRNKGIGAEKVRPSLRANKRQGN